MAPGRARVFSIPSIIEPPFMPFITIKAVEYSSLSFHRNAFAFVFPHPGPKIGDTITIRRPARFDIASGRGRITS